MLPGEALGHSLVAWVLGPARHRSLVGPGLGVWEGLGPLSTVPISSGACPSCPVPCVSKNGLCGQNLSGEMYGRGWKWAGRSPRTLHLPSADQTLPLA